VSYVRGHFTNCHIGQYLLQGIVGTTAGTLWYINWVERTSIRLISGHNSRVRTTAGSY